MVWWRLWFFSWRRVTWLQCPRVSFCTSQPGLSECCGERGPPGGNDIGCHVGPFFKNVCWINKYVIRRLFLFYVNFGYVLMSRYFLEGLTRLLDEILNRHELVGKNYDFVAQNWQTKCFNLQFCLKCLLWTCNLRSKIKLVTPPPKKRTSILRTRIHHLARLLIKI